jgi:hypothetical protein
MYGFGRKRDGIRCRSACVPVRERIGWLFIGAVLALAAASHAQAQLLPSHSERTGWRELTPHDSVVAFYETLVAQSGAVRLQEAGRSREGRPLLLVTMARPAVTRPWEAHASGKPIVFISAQVHGDEPAGKEGLMLFARDLALGELAPLLDSLVFVFVPQVNPDGAEAGTWGTRANRAGYNINRDYLRLVNPESDAIVSALSDWRPHIVVDAHELTGARGYDFYTLHPTSLNAPAPVVRLAADGMTAAVRAALEAAGHTWFPYHLQPSDPTRVATLGLQPAEYGGRTLRGYGGEIGAVTLLFESRRETDARFGIGPRARMHRIAMEAVARFASQNAERVLSTVREARGPGWPALAGDSIAVTADMVARGIVDYRMPEVRRAASGGYEDTGRIVTLRVPIRDSAAAVLKRARPAGYLIEAHREDIARHLARHGLAVERLGAPVRLAVESFRLDSVAVAATEYEGYLPRRARAAIVADTVDAPSGSFLVRTDQPAAGVLFSLLEPESVESLLTTAWLIPEERAGAVLPIHRLRAWPAVPTSLLTRPITQ